MSINDNEDFDKYVSILQIINAEIFKAWRELEVQVEAPVLRNIFPWREIYERKDFDANYEK